MQKLQESVFSIVKTSSLSSAVFDFLQPTEEYSDKTPLGGILRDTKFGWLALGSKFCVVDLRSGIKIAAHTFGNGISSRITVTSVVELPTPLTDNSQQLVISLECDGVTSLICVFHINGSQILRCIQTDVVITELAVCDDLQNGPLMCFDGLVMAGTCRGEVLVFDLNRSILIQGLRNISKGYEHLVRGENNVANLVVLPLKSNIIHKIESQRNLAVLNENHLGILLNDDSFVDGQYIFRNPDGTVRMKAKQNHIRVTVVKFVPQLGSLAVGFNFGAFQIWNLINLELEFTSQVNVECLPVTHFGFQEPCDDPRAFCYLWVVFSVIDRFEEEAFPLAVMYSLTYQGKRALDDGKGLYQDFSSAAIRFQIELNVMEDVEHFIGGRCISCHTYSIRSILGEEGEDTMLNLCQLIWECWGENPNSATQHGMLLFDLDQWYKDQMPETYPLQSNAFMSTARCPEVNRGSCLTLDLRLDPASVAPYSHAMRLEEHFYPNSLQYNCIWLNTSEASILHTVGAQRQLIVGINAAGPSCLLSPSHLQAVCSSAGLTPLYCDPITITQDDQRRYLLSVALEGRLSQFLKRCAHDWATGTHSGVGCTLPFLIDWSWKRAIELKENAKDLTAPLFTSATLPDRNVVRCLEHCVQQLTQLTGLLDAILTKCCNLVIPDALSEMEEKYKGIGTVSLYFQVVQWFVRVGLLPERLHSYNALPYPAHQLYSTYNKRRVKLHRLQDKTEEDSASKSCPLLYIDQLIEHEFGGERVYQMWMKAGSECGGLYPPPSLYALLRLYLLPEIAEEHKHSLLLYLLLDYSMLYDDMRYEAVIRRLMQFPTMFGLSNTAIKATQAFWHLDHRDFDFALDQLQCLTGNTLSDWQHHVVLSSLLAQKKTQAALQYLHVRKPPPIQKNNTEINDLDKLEDWQSCCNLYLARGLVFEALDVIRMCVQNAGSIGDKVHLLNFFYKGCRNTGQLSKVLQVTLLPFEEEVFINFLKDCNEPQTSDILIMYYLQQARYIEAQQYNDKMKSRNRMGDVTSTSTSTLLQGMDRASGVDALVSVMCSALPNITATVARCAQIEYEPQVIKSKPMSVYVQANSPKKTFTYKSSFIQDTIENASETWIHKPKMRKGMKRALNVEETPFICTPKMNKVRSLLSEQRDSEATPPKRLKIDFTGSPRTPKAPCTIKVSESLSRQMASFLDMPEVESPHKDYDRGGAETPQSILKNRRLESRNQEAPSPVDSRYLGESDEELETASNHTHYSDSNKHLRFTIPTPSEAESTPSPVPVPVFVKDIKEETIENDMEDYGHRASPMSDSHELESPPKKFAAEEIKSKKLYKDNVRARKSLSISINSSLSDDPNSSVESIADIPITLINPRYSAEKYRLSPSPRPEENIQEIKKRDDEEIYIKEEDKVESFVPKTPQSRRSIRSASARRDEGNRSHSGTPERVDSPTVTPLRSNRATRSRSRTPELSPRSSLAPIQEQPKQEVESEPHAIATTLSVPRVLRSRSRTPERVDKGLMESPRLEPIKELTCVTESPPASPTRRSGRSRSQTPEVEIAEQPIVSSPRLLRSRSKTPEKLMSPKKEPSRNKKSLSRIVLEANTFAKTKQTEKIDTETVEKNTQTVIECTPMKLSQDIPRLMDVTFSPIVNKSVLISSSENISLTDDVSEIKPLPAFTTISNDYTEKSVLHSYESSIADLSIPETKEIQSELKSLPVYTNITEDFCNSVLHSFESSVETSTQEQMEIEKLPHFDLPEACISLNENDFGKSVLSSANSTKEGKIDSSLMTSDSEVEIKDWKSQESVRVMKEKERIVEIEREINEIEGEMSDECRVESDSEIVEESAESGGEENTDDEEGSIEEEGSSEQEEEEEDSDSESVNEVISIDDSDESTDNLQIDVQPLELEAQETTVQITNQGIKNEDVVSNIIEQISVENKVENRVTSIEEKKGDTVLSMVEDLIDPLDQAPNMSILTDDNSIIESESINLNYSDENKLKGENKQGSEAMDTEPDEIIKSAIKPSSDNMDSDTVAMSDNIGETTLVRKELDIVDAGLLIDTSEGTNFKVENKTGISEVTQQEIKDSKKDAIVQSPFSQVEVNPITHSLDSKDDEDMETEQTPLIVEDIVETTEQETFENKQQSEETKEQETFRNKQQSEETKEQETFGNKQQRKETKEQETFVSKEQSEETKKQETFGNKQQREETKERETFVSKEQSEETKKQETFGNKQQREETKEQETFENKQQNEQDDKNEKPTVSRKRSQSISSTKSLNLKPKTASTRKRTQSNASLVSEDEQNTPEQTISSTRAKTPVSDVRIIIARRTSKEIFENYEESLSEDILTPKRRSSRSRSKKDDDNISLASEDISTPKRRSTRTRSIKEDDNVSVGSDSSISLSKKITKPNKDLEDPSEVVATPKRRSTRTRSKKEDDNISVASDSSIPHSKKITQHDIDDHKEQLEDISTPKRRSTRTRSKKEDDDLSVASESPTKSSKRTPRRTPEIPKEQTGETSTPRRRSTRSKSKIEDNNSVASDSSIKSGVSKGNEEGDTKVRKGRKSILNIKTDLSVIPEVTAEESKEDNKDILLELSTQRRLTRHQKTVLKSWLEPKPQSPGPSRRSSVASDVPAAEDDDDASSVHSLDSQTVERINLMNKKNFEGSPDPDELSNFESTLAGRRSRMTRAASETKSLAKPARIARSVSVDIGTTPEVQSPASADTDTPTRGRRASFARACEALHTPKGRRSSVDQRKVESASQQGSPASEAEAPATPSRRPRRVSTASSASQTVPERRPRKSAGQRKEMNE